MTVSTQIRLNNVGALPEVDGSPRCFVTLSTAEFAKDARWTTLKIGTLSPYIRI